MQKARHQPELPLWEEAETPPASHGKGKVRVLGAAGAGARSCRLHLAETQEAGRGVDAFHRGEKGA